MQHIFGQNFVSLTIFYGILHKILHFRIFKKKKKKKKKIQHTCYFFTFSKFCILTKFCTFGIFDEILYSLEFVPIMYSSNRLFCILKGVEVDL